MKRSQIGEKTMRTWIFVLAAMGVLFSSGGAHAQVCGDETIDDGVEVCDDGNDDNTDGCVEDCVIATCGDGFLHIDVETCDPGPDGNTPDCDIDCTVPECGDGVYNNAAEQCDPTDITSPGCNDDCSSAAYARGSGGCGVAGASSTFGALLLLGLLFGFARPKKGAYLAAAAALMLVACGNTGECPVECNGGCKGGTCVIYDSYLSVVCPSGWPCEVRCSSANSCPFDITCSDSDCTVVCGDGASAGNMCSGAIDCSAASNCTVTCMGGGSCGGEITCGYGLCDVECSGASSCAEPILCDFAESCEIDCPGDSSCPGGVQY
jgi:hypothetical protein